MTQLDYAFYRNCQFILHFGYSDEGLEVRPRWSDGTPAHTRMIFNHCDAYDLIAEPIPILTLRQTNFQACVDEILWIYQRCSNNIKDLKSHIWDSWADKTGSIGKTYGYQIAQRFRHHKYIPGEDLSDYPSAFVHNDKAMAEVFDLDPELFDDDSWVWMNQIDGAIWTLRNNPTDRGIITNMYNHQDLADMNLRPCAYSLTFNVGVDKDGNKELYALLNQRSQDMVTANGWNVTQYAVLAHMIAQVCGMKAAGLTHMVTNMHIYDRHIPIAKELIRRFKASEFGLGKPSLWINPEIKSFKDFTVDDIRLIGYDYNHDPLPKIEVAV